MKSHEKSEGEREGNAESSYDTLKDMQFKANIAREADQLRSEYEDRKAQTDAARDNLESFYKSSGQFYSEGTGEVREVQYDSRKAEKDFAEKSVAQAKAGDALEKLDTPEKIAAEAERRKRESEDFDKYFVGGATSETIRELNNLDERIAETRDPDAKARLENRKQELIKEAVANGKTKAGAVELAREKDAKADNDLKRAERHFGRKERKEQAFNEKIKEMMDAANNIASEMSRETIVNCGGSEHIGQENALKMVRECESQVRELKDKRKELVDKDISTKEQDKKIAKREETLEKYKEKLERFGYSRSNEKESTYGAVDKAIGDSSQFSIGHRKALQYNFIKLALADRSTRKLAKRSLKEHGFKKGLPEDWQTSYGITLYELNTIAYSIKY